MPPISTLVRGLSAAAVLAWSTQAMALELKPYDAQALATAQQAGQAVAVHFHADWCPTCKLQAKAFDSLKAEQGLDITVLVANYDTEKDLKKRMNVRTQSTLVVFRGTAEKARLAGDTSADKIRSALKAAL